MLCLLGCILLRLRERYRDDVLRLLFLDVGQGDAALVVFPGGKTALIDAGGGYGEWDVGRREILPELARRGILTLDFAVLTHPDQDHGYGFRSLLADLRVGELWFSADLLARPPKPLFLEIREIAKRHGITESPIARTLRNVGGVEWEAWASSGQTPNDWALLSRFRYAGCEILFTADIEAEGERVLARKTDRPITLLKVAHHGSRTSSSPEFLRRARPRWAVISAGHRNRYGHPHPAVLSRLARFQTHVLRTDFHGFVEFTISRGGQVECRSAQGACGISSCGGGL